MVLQLEARVFWVYLGIAILVGLALGGVGIWLVLRGRRKTQPKPGPERRDGIYLLFSRISHELKTAREVIRGHLHGFGEELPADAERWRVAYRVISDEADGLERLIHRLDLVVRIG